MEKGLGATTALWKWYGHNLAKWAEFRRRHLVELKRSAQARAFKDLVSQGRTEVRLTLMYSAADQKHNQAVVLKQFLEGKTGS